MSDPSFDLDHADCTQCRQAQQTGCKQRRIKVAGEHTAAHNNSASDGCCRSQRVGKDYTVITVLPVTTCGQRLYCDYSPAGHSVWADYTVITVLPVTACGQRLYCDDSPADHSVWAKTIL